MIALLLGLHLLVAAPAAATRAASSPAPAVTERGGAGPAGSESPGKRVEELLGKGGSPGTGGAPGRRVIRGGGPGDPFGRPQRTAVPAAGVEVAMLEGGHLPVVEVLIQGQGPFRFAIDTGAGGTARIDSALAARLGLERVGEVRGGDPSGRNTRTLALVAIDSLAVGAAGFSGVQAAVRDFSERKLTHGIDGILGFGLFAETLLTLDYPRRRVRISRGELPIPDGERVLEYRDGRGIPQVTLRVAGIEVEADVDAGSQGGFILPESLVERLALASEPVVVGKARTTTNTFEIRQAELAGEIALGSFTFAAPRVDFQPLFPHANIGARVLRDFEITFDPRNRRLRLERPS